MRGRVSRLAPQDASSAAGRVDAWGQSTISFTTARSAGITVLNFDLTPRSARRSGEAQCAARKHLSNWGQIPILDSSLIGARGLQRNWALTPIATRSAGTA